MTKEIQKEEERKTAVSAGKQKKAEQWEKNLKDFLCPIKQTRSDSQTSL